MYMERKRKFFTKDYSKNGSPHWVWNLNILGADREEGPIHLLLWMTDFNIQKFQKENKLQEATVTTIPNTTTSSRKDGVLAYRKTQ